jgi:hypothetical protein
MIFFYNWKLWFPPLNDFIFFELQQFYYHTQTQGVIGGGRETLNRPTKNKLKAKHKNTTTQHNNNNNKEPHEQIRSCENTETKHWTAHTTGDIN